MPETPEQMQARHAREAAQYPLPGETAEQTQQRQARDNPQYQAASAGATEKKKSTSEQASDLIAEASFNSAPDSIHAANVRIDKITAALALLLNS